jgi:hypothetical protein
MVQMRRLHKKPMVQFAQCALVMLVSKNVKHANKPFAYWSSIE